jgi:hypothetical protein
MPECVLAHPRSRAASAGIEIIVLRPCHCRIIGRHGMQALAAGSRASVAAADAAQLVTCADVALYLHPEDDPSPGHRWTLRSQG